ncbi:MAG: TetR/AcrR family transcriptional regulator [Actinobacteria bacterium]|nr:MAG: TetR/AcrR family transcriptional regulator [Actinomycetota bacterium]
MVVSNRKQLILEDVKEVFAKKGFYGSTSKDLAKAAGVSEALLYKHFPSKESLFKESLKTALEPYKRLTETKDQGITNRLRHIANNFLRLDDETFKLLLFSYMELDKKYLQEYVEYFKNKIKALLNDNQNNKAGFSKNFDSTMISLLVGYKLLYPELSSQQVLEVLTKNIIKT